MRNQRGEGIISVMISIAILGVLIVTVVTLYQMFGAMMAKSLLRREADLLANRVRGVLMRRDLCDQALVGNLWDGTSTQEVVIRRNGGAVLAQQGVLLANGRLRLGSVAIRPFQVDANGDGVVDSLTTSTNQILNGVPVTSHSGEVVMRFQLGDSSLQSDVADRKAAVLVQVDSGNVIRGCDINEESTNVNKNCTINEAIADGHPCPTTLPAPHIGTDCREFTYVGGVDGRGEPLCHCTWSCQTPIWKAQGATGTCTSTSVVTSGTLCPVSARGTGTPTPCYGQAGSFCTWKEIKPALCPNPLRRYMVYRSRCEL